jgi:hypothetical protein
MLGDPASLRAEGRSSRTGPSGDHLMRTGFVAACVALILTSTTARAASVAVELNTAETTDNKCRITFVIENKDKESLESLKLDLAVFTPQRIVTRRLATELGPVRGGKTVVKTFALDGGCGEIGSILVNDVTCAPGAPNACLDGLELTSRMQGVRLYK